MSAPVTTTTNTKPALSKEEIDQIIELAMQARSKSHSPYSKFRVGACILTADGQYISGCNVENASYGLSICAERTAYCKAVSDGFSKFKAIAVSTDVEDRWLSPCGACRQFAAEFGEHYILMVKPDKTYRLTTVTEMLPGSFTPGDLDAPRAS
eukprot:TRINITY_DN1941_c0_g1_i1.p1 TRINITY_DN1941_c0_g1~~TRINITY_DN1941_c0_g1_i1.p1  ORF type:complete len:153 (-),score=38.44 TRINITY_DN1941_c0_g1_i1:287-745(-)